MKEKSKSKEIEWLGSNYEFTVHLGSNVIEIREQVKSGIFNQSYKWKLIYFGHIDPLSEAVKFFTESLKK